MKSFWQYLVWLYDGKPEPESEHDKELTFIVVTGWGPFRLPREVRRHQEARKKVRKMIADARPCPEEKHRYNE